MLTRRLAAMRLEDRVTPAGAMLPNLQVYQPDMPTGNMTVNASHEIRFSTSLTNVGVGPFDLRANGIVINNSDGTQSIGTNQRLYIDENNNGYYDEYNATTNPNGDHSTGFTEQLAGNFSYHSTHGHMHFNEFAIARLRVRPADNSLGAVVAVGPKTSFCLIDIGRPYPNLPGSPTTAQYSCDASHEGISVGWKDVYSSGLDGQFINVTNIPNGNYWLEIECDYANHILELNDADNVSRTMITIGNQPATGFMVLSSTPVGAQQGAQSYVDFQFNQEVDPATFTTAAVSFTGPPGNTNISVTSVQMIDGAKFRVNFASQGGIGTYQMTLNSSLIRNTSGQLLDQNNNGTTGEAGDGYTGIFTITAPNITTVTPTGSTAAPVSSVRIAYNRAMTSGTFTTADVLSFTGPGGANLLGTITGVTPVTAGGQSTAFDIAFSPVSTGGVYTLVIGADVQDTNGNWVDQNNNGTPNEPADQYSTAFSLPVAGIYGPDAFGYTAVSTPYQAIAMTGATGLTFTNTDDEAQALNLGADSFNFYGTTYTGNAALFASTNAMITFGSGSTAWDNNNALSSLGVPVIAPLWDDWIIGSGNPQVRYLRTSSQLIVEWNQIRHYNTTTGGISVQAILELNTGNRPGRITFNYADLDQGDPSYNNGAAATVGLRSSTAMNSTLVVSNNSNSHPLVGSNKAMLLSVPYATEITRLDPSPAPDGFVHYQVTFSEGVTGVDPSDFTLTTTGNITGQSVSGVIATADPKVWQLVVNSDIGSGTLRMNLLDNDSIISQNGAKLGGAGLVNGDFNTGEVYTIVQRPPQVFHVAYGNGSAQRSRINQIQVAFDHGVTFSSTPEAAIQIIGPNGPVALVIDPDLGTDEQTVCMITFAANGPDTENGSLKDGKYTLTVLASQVNTAGVLLDGNGDGTAGDDYTTSFHRLFGDSDGNGTVNQVDYNAFRDAYLGGPSLEFDFGGDGQVNLADFNQFRNRFLTTL